MKLVLASSSPYRRALLERLGVGFEAYSPAVDETARPDEEPRELASRLAKLKAKALAKRFPDAYVIGSDQVIALGAAVLNKPGSADAACAQLAQLSGKSHELITAVHIVSPAGEGHEVMTHQMRMRSLSPDEIARYVAEDEPLDCAGSYKIEAGGIRLFESLAGDDYTSIVGLPLTAVRRLLDQLHFEWNAE